MIPSQKKRLAKIKKAGRGARRQRIGRFASAALKALRIAVAKTIEEHRRSGDPIIVWENGRVVKIPADRIPRQKIAGERSL